jgi:cell wall-associated NlpC family hydrolase
MRVAPLDLTHPDIALERFDYSRVGTRWAVVRLVTRMRTDVGLPADPRLVVDHGAADGPHVFPVRACRTEQRLPGGAGGTLLWRGTFAMPVELVEHSGAAFALRNADALALALPVPRLRQIQRRSLELRPPLGPRAGLCAPGQMRRRAAALATAAALTTTSTPAVALASAGSGDSTTTTAGAPVTNAATTTQTTQTAATTQTTTATTATTTTTTTVGAPAPTTPAPAGVDPAATPPATDSTTTATPPATVPTTTAAPPAVTDPAASTATTTATTATSAATDPAAPTPAATATTTTPVTTTPVPTTPAAPVTATVPVTTTATTTATVPLTPRLPTTGPVIKVNGAGTHAGAVAGPTVTGPRRSAHEREHRHSGTGPAASPPHHGQPSEPAPPSVLTSAARREAQARARAQRAVADRRLAILNAGVRQALTAERDAADAADAQAMARSTQSSAAPASLTATAPARVPLLSADPGFSGPGSWTGTVSSDPALTGAVRNLSGLLAQADRPPSFLIPIYMQAARRYHVPWEVLAAINNIESDYGRDLNTSSAGALGWMQFEPSTWKQYGLAADGHSTPNPYDPRDAIFSAAKYLQAAGGSADIRRAVFAYNHADWYVDEVMQRAQGIAEHAQFEKEAIGRRGTVSVFFATGSERRPHVRYRGGVMSHYDRLVASANMVSAADFPYLWGGGHEEPARFGPFDCSGAVSYVMQQAGYQVPTTVAGDIGAWQFPTGPGRVTIFYNSTHTFMRIGHRFFGTSGFARPGGGAGWFDVNRLPESYLAGFNEVHVPKLGGNSFAPTPPLGLRPRHELAHRDLQMSRISHARQAERAETWQSRRG